MLDRLSLNMCLEIYLWARVYCNLLVCTFQDGFLDQEIHLHILQYASLGRQSCWIVCLLICVSKSTPGREYNLLVCTFQNGFLDKGIHLHILQYGSLGRQSCWIACLLICVSKSTSGREYNLLVCTFQNGLFDQGIYPERLERGGGGGLLTIKTEENEDSKSTNERVLPWLVHWACRAGTRDFCPASAALVSPVQNIFSSPCTTSIHLSPSPSKLDRQSCCVACLLICVSESTSGWEYNLLVCTFQNGFLDQGIHLLHLLQYASLGRQSCWVACLLVCVSESTSGRE